MTALPMDEPEMGRVTVSVDLMNYGDLLRFEAGEIAASSVRRIRVKGVVDTGATHMVIPPHVVEDLGLPLHGEASVRYADNRTANRRIAEALGVELFGRRGDFRAIVEPDRKDVLIGAIVLEDLDLLVDCARQTLLPRDPDRIMYEIE